MSNFEIDESNILGEEEIKTKIMEIKTKVMKIKRKYNAKMNKEL